MSEGALIVLTADRTLMSAYELLFDAMIACTQTTSTPPLIMNSLLLPRVRHTHGRADFAPIGLRRIQGALLSDGFADEDVVICDDQHLEQAIGPDTAVIGISTGEPLGLGMSSTTMAAIAGGQIYPAAMFEDLMDRVNELKEKLAPNARVLVGGAGVWQLVADEDARRRLGIDHLVQGPAEEITAQTFADLAAGKDLPEIIEGQCEHPQTLEPLAGPTVMGACEISRGCGYGCDFCIMGTEPMVHLPVDTIAEDAATNVEAGMYNVALLSEDILRYGSENGSCEPECVLDLLKALRWIDHLQIIQTDHANVCSIAQFSDAELALLRRLLVGEGDWASWLNVGVETASGQLLEASGGGPKTRGTDPKEWGRFCALQIRRLVQAGFIPIVSLVIGLPEETAQHIEQTHEWVRSLSDLPVCVFPVLYAPLNDDPSPDPDELSAGVWSLIAECYDRNFRWVPRLYYEQQAAAGVSLPKRGIMQLLGQAQAFVWKRRLAACVRSAEQ